MQRVGIPTFPSVEMSVENQEAMVLPLNGCSEGCILELGKAEENVKLLLVELDA